ncbi:MAG: hypothetical protein ACXWQO_19410 [Bdellovibrionota bacterium]
MNIKKICRIALPVLTGVIALTTLVACDTSVRIGFGRAYDRVWYGDPYCRNSWDYGCGYNSYDGARIGIVFGHRHPGWRWGGRGWGLVATDASRPTSWEKEFHLSSRSVTFLKNAFNDALEGKTQQLNKIGISNDDINGLQQFRMPSSESLAKAALALRVSQRDMRDFVEVFMIRMKTAVATVN